ncbi:MAG TPA: extracellular solute-binding protein [Bryobacteraceae bacterium]|jgi:molybdate/tungstate transport system substrate-binding protein|nr:extracellular solute-binding protein [Bryobacteraceae bacterium]
MRILALLTVFAAASQGWAQTNCVPASKEELVIYRAGSLTRAFQPLIAAFTCRTGIQVKDHPMGSVDAGRQITAGGQKADLYAPADYLDIDLFMKPAGLADFDIVFAHGRMVLAYSARGLAEKKLPPIAQPGDFHPPNAIPKAAANWYEILTMPRVTIGGGNFFLDPGAYRAPMIFQLAEAFYKVPNLYNNLLEQVIIPGADSGAALGKGLDFQFTYEHNARATALTNPDYRYVDLPDEINLSDTARDAYYRQNAVVVLPGLGVPRSERTVAVPAARVAWGITLMKGAPNRENAVRFLELLLSGEGTAALRENGPDPITPPVVSAGDLRKLPEALRKLLTRR